VKPAPVEYVRPESLELALEVLAAHGDEAKPLAGGQSLTPMLNLRLARPEVLVDVNRLPLAGVELDERSLTLGALVRHRTVAEEPRIAAAAPLLARAAAHVGHPAIRNRGTLGGSLVHADPTAELAIAALALEATVEVASARGRRTIAAGELFAGPYTTTVAPEELVVAIRVPRAAAGERCGFAEIAQREGDFAFAAAACRLTVADGRVTAASVALGGPLATPVRLEQVERALVGAAADGALAEAAAEACPQLDARADVHASGEFRAELARVMIARAVAQALEES